MRVVLYNYIIIMLNKKDYTSPRTEHRAPNNVMYVTIDLRVKRFIFTRPAFIEENTQASNDRVQ